MPNAGTSAADHTAELVGEPSAGRVFRTSRRVRLGDVSPGGRLRLDAVVRYLQDVGDDDTRDARFTAAAGWVARRTTLRVDTFPVYNEHVTCATWCGGTGSRWAERRTSFTGELGGKVEAATLWVHVDPTTMRPAPLPAEFAATYGPAAQGREVRPSLRHADAPDAGVERHWEWSPRVVDFDPYRHVNNAAFWIVVEEELHRRRDLRAPLVAEMEHRQAVDRDEVVGVGVADGGNELALWMSVAGSVRASATVARL